MTMPRRPQKKVVVPKPPEYLPPTDNIPPELQALLGNPGTASSWAWFIEYWKKVNPQGFFEQQFTDYIGKLYNAKLAEYQAEYEANPNAPRALEKFAEKEKALRDRLEGADAQMRFRRGKNLPIQDMPFYDEIQQEDLTQSPSIQKGFNEFVNQQRQQQMADQQAQSEFEQKYSEYVTKREQAEIIPQQKARLAQYQQGQEALQSPMSSVEARIALRDAVARGEILPQEAYGPGSAWEQWQNQGAGAENARNIVPMQFRNNNIFEEPTTQTTGAQRQQLATARIAQGQANAQANQAVQARQSQILAAQYPDAFKQWQTASMQSGANDPFGFARWATAKGDDENQLTPEQIAFQQSMKDDQLTKWKTYGDIYGQYQDYLDQPDSELKPIEQFIEGNPLLKLAYDQRLGRRKTQAPSAVWR